MSTLTSRTQTHLRRNVGPAARTSLGEPTITSFACDVVDELQDVARGLSKEPGTKAFFSPLAAALGNAREHLNRLNEGLGNIESVPRLLDNLERLCQVSFFFDLLEIY